MELVKGRRMGESYSQSEEKFMMLAPVEASMVLVSILSTLLLYPASALSLPLPLSSLFLSALHNQCTGRVLI